MTHRNMEPLPKQFVQAMRTLFDIMDDKQTGYVKLTDIENRWRNDRTRGLPNGVIENLQKVASHDGLLSFENFCSGLKICLLRNQVDNYISCNGNSREVFINQSLVNRPHAGKIVELNNVSRDRQWTEFKTESSEQHLTRSVPQLAACREAQVQDLQRNNIKLQQLDQLSRSRVYQTGPPKPPRLEKPITEGIDDSTKAVNKTVAEKLYTQDFRAEEIVSVDKKNRGHGDGRPDSESLQTLRRTRRREPRRHTLHNGVDYNLLKRMAQIEQERDVLLQGLAAIEEAREWYLKNLSEVQEKMRYVGRMGAYIESYSEAQQERLELLRVRVLELNRQLRALAAPAAAGWRGALHMNLALPALPPLRNLVPAPSPPPQSQSQPQPQPQPQPQLSATLEPARPAVLHAQKQMLVEKVNRKTEKISVLECEKSSLIRELLLQRNRNQLI